MEYNMNRTDIIDGIVSKFREVFGTATVSYYDGYRLFTIVKESRLCTLYTIDIDSCTPYRRCTMRLSFVDDSHALVGMADSMTVDCREIVDFTIGQLKSVGYDVDEYVTGGE